MSTVAGAYPKEYSVLMVDLVDPPGFDTDGTPPPLESLPIFVGQDFFVVSSTSSNAIEKLRGSLHVGAEFVDASEWVRQNEHLIANFRGEFWEVWTTKMVRHALATALTAPAAIVVGPITLSLMTKGIKQALKPVLDPDGIELRRFQCTKKWQREDPVAQLAPGATSTRTITRTMGITSMETREMSSSLGLKENISPVQLNSQLSSRLSRTLTLSERHQSSEGITLKNDQQGYYRKFAIWHITFTITIDALIVANDTLKWDRKTDTTFAASSALILTSIDVPSGQP